MSITLHWWIVPILMVAAAIYCATRTEHGDYDFGPALFFAAWIIGAIAVTIGHFL